MYSARGVERGAHEEADEEESFFARTFTRKLSLHSPPLDGELNKSGGISGCTSWDYQTLPVAFGSYYLDSRLS